MRLYCCLNPSRRARERATRGRLASHVGHRTGDAANQDRRPDLHRWIVSPGQTFQRTPDFSQDPMSAQQFLVQNRKLCYIFALVGSVERGQKRIDQPAEGRTDFFVTAKPALNVGSLLPPASS